MVARNLSIKHEFICFTENPEGLNCKTSPLPDLEGWWNKVYLFKEDLFDKKILFLDLDVVITGSLDHIAKKEGFWIIQDWHLPTYNSSVFVLSPNERPKVWRDFTKDVPKRFSGDQDWITHKAKAHTFKTSWCVSYRSHATHAVPENTKVVCFHGNPKPHEYTSDWIKALWK